MTCQVQGFLYICVVGVGNWVLAGQPAFRFYVQMIFVGKPWAEDRLWNLCQNKVNQPNNYNQRQDKLFLSVGSDGIFIF